MGNNIVVWSDQAGAFHNRTLLIRKYQQKALNEVWLALSPERWCAFIPCVSFTKGTEQSTPQALGTVIIKPDRVAGTLHNTNVTNLSPQQPYKTVYNYQALPARQQQTISHDTATALTDTSPMLWLSAPKDGVILFLWYQSGRGTEQSTPQ